MATEAAERESAVAAADETCPRCGARRRRDQRYCLDCGLALPDVTGRVASLRRRWIRRFGWYPGDWVWMALLTLVIAAAGATAAVIVAEKTEGAGRPAVATSPGATSPADRKRPAPRANGHVAWPASWNGWTIVLVSYPSTRAVDARETTARAVKAGLHLVGILDSSRYASLQPGYLVVFSGIYGSQDDADAAVATARQAGFAGAYSRQVAR
jgi:hypothetical protein